ncbi:unnamed protein product [Thelazia callipaeda]|uniref:SEA domain-containing protein n=1 Tax=Thelazia callipaeda TaxID=103827 RepID=A0A0N5CVE7_THECL|nr:unnamed protein product [Thelazia callipaeda]
MDEELIEIKELLEDAKLIKVPSYKKCFKLVLPHVVLVAVVCLYTVIGAWVFYTLESPYEDMMKKIGIERITQQRDDLLKALWMKRKELKRFESDVWIHSTNAKLQEFNECLYKAFKDYYVR